MSEELRETVEILQIGADFTLRIMDMTKESIQSLFAAGNSIRMGKAGRTSFKGIMKNCAEHGIAPITLSFPSEDKEILDKAEQMLKKMNVQFAKLPDYMQGDYKTQYLVSGEQAQFFNLVAKKIYDSELAKIKENGGEKEDMPIKKDECEIHKGNEYAELMPRKDYKEAVKGIKEMTDPNYTPSREEQINAEKMKMNQRYEETKHDSNYKYLSINKDALILKDNEKDKMSCIIPNTKANLRVSFRKTDIVFEDNVKIAIAVNKNEYFSVRNHAKKKDEHIKGDNLFNYFDEMNVNRRNGNLHIYQNKTRNQRNNKTRNKKPKAKVR